MTRAIMAHAGAGCGHAEDTMSRALVLHALDEIRLFVNPTM